MPTYRLPVCLLVEDFVDQGLADDDWDAARELAFEDAAEAEDEPRAVLLAAAKDAGVTVAAEGPVLFEDFDSGNISHANAHYVVTFEASVDDAVALALHYYGDVDALEEAE